MPITKAKCTHCGAVIFVDSSRDADFCQLCGTPFVVEKAIKNYDPSAVSVGYAATNQVPASENLEFKIRSGVLEKYDGNNSEVTVPTNILKIGDSAFEGCFGLKSIVIPEGVVEIGKSSFLNCENLVTVRLPETLTKIGDSAFSGCAKLPSINIPESVTEIGESAFSNCIKFERFVIPKSMTKLSREIFADCKNLKEVILPTTVKTLEGNSFKGCFSLRSISENSEVPSVFDPVLKELGNYLIISDTIVKIGHDAFNGLFNNGRIQNVVILGQNCRIECGSFCKCNVNIYARKNTVHQLNSFFKKLLDFFNSTSRVIRLSSIEYITKWFFNNTRDYNGNSVFNVKLDELSACLSVDAPYTFVDFHINLNDIDAKLEKIKKAEQKRILSEKAKAAEEAAKKEAEEKQRKIEEWKRKGLCAYCGGEFIKKMFSCKCSKCGQKKDY